MKNPPGKTVVLGGSMGTILQSFGIIRGLSPRGTEIDLFWAIACFSIGTLIWMATLESLLLARGRSRLWSLLAPLGILAAGVIFPKGSRDRLISSETVVSAPKPLCQRTAGLLLVTAVTVGFVWAGSQLVRRDKWPPRLAERTLRKNEAATVTRLHELVEAQRQYRESDWDGDGQRQYAPFLVHLWRSVDMSGQPLEVHLLPRAFAIAMSPAWAVDGYYFTDLRRRQLQPASAKTNSTTRQHPGDVDYGDIDLYHGWAVCATPAAYGETGFATFVVDQTGTIWGKDQPSVQTFYPDEPQRFGWVEITDEGALDRLQDSIDYKP